MDIFKLVKMLTAYVLLATLPSTEKTTTQQSDQAKALKDLNDSLAEAEKAAKDDPEKAAQVKEITEQLTQLRKDVDANAEQASKLAKLGMSQGGNGGLVIQDYDQIMALRRVSCVFRLPEQAKAFGAMAARSIWGGTGKYEDMVAESTRSRAEELVKAMEPGASGAGAELIQNLYMADLIRHVEAVGNLYTQCQRVPMLTLGQTTWPKRTGGLTAYPTAALAAIEESTMALGTVTMQPVKWGVITSAGNEMFKDPSLLVALGQLLALEITRAIAYAFDNAVANGDGTADYGGITGVLQSANITAITASAAATIGAYTGAQVSDVVAGLTKDYVTEPRWNMSLSAERTLRALKSTTGAPLYAHGSNGEPNTIDGLPYDTCQRFPAAATVAGSTKWGILGDLRLSHFFGMMGNIEIALSEHAGFRNDMTYLRGIAYADCQEQDADAIVVMKTHA